MANKKKTIAQVFYNCFICSKNIATNYSKQHLDTRNIEQEQCINDLHAYTINSLLPYAYRHIEENILKYNEIQNYLMLTYISAIQKQKIFS